MAYRPDFEIDNDILNLVSDISVLIDRIPDGSTPPRDLRLRRTNRIKSIHSSLGIEGNTLTFAEVTDIIDGKRVIGNSKEIDEVKGAVTAYNRMGELDPESIGDLLEAHKALMGDLIESSGKFRDHDVGVYKGSIPVHIAPSPEEVPSLMKDLLDWMKTSDIHPLIKSCIFHCRFEFIHPFADGNGRIGRLWHSLILSKWKCVFTYMPIETWIKLNQKEYYDALAESDDGNLDVFIKFMLRIIMIAVEEYADELSVAKCIISEKEALILDLISEDPALTSAKMAATLGVSDRTIKRYISSLVEKGLIKREGSDKTGHWKII